MSPGKDLMFPPGYAMVADVLAGCAWAAFRFPAHVHKELPSDRTLRIAVKVGRTRWDRYGTGAGGNDTPDPFSHRLPDHV